MDAVTRAHAFQPFFTTKKMGDGRGLGLATVYGIVKQSHGFVWVDSEVGKGATFTLLFPAMKPGRSDVASGTSATEAETILVVEEDASARLFVGDALRRRGYQVLEAPTAAAALEMFASHPKRVHLLLSDAASVTEDGAPLAARLKAIDPMVQSLVMIEESHGEAGEHHVLPTTPAIQKPFTLQALGAKVREVLDSGEGR
jgi:two-component system cell cycle sensor histidine kinase/response regulator CckA